MTLTQPIEISPRLLPSVRIGDAWIQIEYGGATPDGRISYHYVIDAGDRSHEARNLKSGVGGGDLVDGLETLLVFLGAAADAYRYEMDGGESENSDLFPAWIGEWAYQHSDEIQLAQLEIEENPNCIEE